VTLRARQIVPLLIPTILLAVALLLSPPNIYGGTQQSTGPIPGGDDWNSASVMPYPAIPVSTIQSLPPGQCAWINAGTAAFQAANPGTSAGAVLDGTGPSGQGWNFVWAGAAVEAQVEAGISITDYYPWVVNQPTVNLPNGTRFSSASRFSGQLTANQLAGAGNIGEVGGAVFNISYAPQPGAPAINVNNLHWIQAYTGSIYGNAFGPILDNGGYGAPMKVGDPPMTPGGPAVAYSAQNSFSPFYDYTFAAGTWGGTAANSGAWFADRPQVPEFNSATASEYEMNPIVSSQFQVVLASDVTSVDQFGVTQNTVTLYGGLWWGYNYTATEYVPEPSTYVLLALGSIGLLVGRRVTRRKVAR
jgi:hypothetical protein